MFSGIVEGLVKSKKIERVPGGMRLTLPNPRGRRLKRGESIAVDGACFTIEEAANETFSVFAMPETIKRTTLNSLTQDHSFNLERPLRLNSLVGGHLVNGHIDTTATVAAVRDEGGPKTVIFHISTDFTRYIVEKGSIALNGVSLTVVSVTKNAFTVSLIPYTLSHTNLGLLRIGDLVNIELDLIGKYVEKLTKSSIY